MTSWLATLLSIIVLWVASKWSPLLLKLTLCWSYGFVFTKQLGLFNDLLIFDRFGIDLMSVFWRPWPFRPTGCPLFVLTCWIRGGL